ncbi:eukaryotic aspartyl protease (macronuclear) [Tetrahymena thermophila SB210]|uniref:Eukaryotic aspartyl protease n=1 Tax=Tetrahymena thermophila (strain SB210) TaxID=312017 RepID=Q24F65_TETTS|nr:eukaryotic aspartyl protease [Tetrahymena thermophila SB210]EAS06410.2 eukaryotic aspartyl protease [Tetrahymena thermophila SB210]|eukprot:XP_001026655.2 eukaryotic aspartyl protease [Tetrahymena thermophila SB210]
MRFAYLLLALIVLQYSYCNIVKIPIKKKIIVDNENQAIDPLVNFNNFMYAGEIEVGKNKQKFSVDFDSGSNLLWLTSKNCPTCRQAGYNNYYDCNTSDECEITNNYTQVAYGDGSSVGGFIANVPVGIDGLGQVINSLLLVQETKNSDNLKSDGLMGLGIYDSSNKDNVSFVSKLYQQGLIDKEEFSFYLDFDQNGSELVFGGFDETKVADPSQVFYHPVLLNGQQNSSQRWVFSLKSVSIGEDNMELQKEANFAIVDSGTSLIAIRNDYFSDFIGILRQNFEISTIYAGTRFYRVQCGTKLPDLTFTITDSQGVDRNYSIPSEFYVINVSGICVIGVQPLMEMDIQFILGDVFMRRFVSIFSYQDKTVGLAQSVSTPPNSNQYIKEQNNLIIRLTLISAAIIIVFGLLYKFKNSF